MRCSWSQVFCSCCLGRHRLHIYVQTSRKILILMFVSTNLRYEVLHARTNLPVHVIHEYCMVLSINMASYYLCAVGNLVQFYLVQIVQESVVRNNYTLIFQTKFIHDINGYSVIDEMLNPDINKVKLNGIIMQFRIYDTFGQHTKNSYGHWHFFFS